MAGNAAVACTGLAQVRAEDHFFPLLPGEPRQPHDKFPVFRGVVPPVDAHRTAPVEVGNCVRKDACLVYPAIVRPNIHEQRLAHTGQEKREFIVNTLDIAYHTRFPAVPVRQQIEQILIHRAAAPKREYRVPRVIRRQTVYDCAAVTQA